MHGLLLCFAGVSGSAAKLNSGPLRPPGGGETFAKDADMLALSRFAAAGRSLPTMDGDSRSSEASSNDSAFALWMRSSSSSKCSPGRCLVGVSMLHYRCIQPSGMCRKRTN